MGGVCIGLMTAGNVRKETVESLLACATTKTVKWMFLTTSGPYLDDGRNNMVLAFNDAHLDLCDRLLMVDSDVEFTPDHVRQLEEDDLPVVAGVYHSPYAGGIKPVVYRWVDCPTGRTMVPIDEWPAGDDPLVEVEGVGAGFLMVKREVFAEMWDHFEKPLPWFAEEVVDGTHLGEDLCFNVRCAELGIKTFVDKRVQVAHHKSIRLCGE